ncbi:MAG: hypothetical protein HY577_01380 [Candidatus Nealsonbacteria bacterium]|nr:hypothetical protein [Candidatus Nealsonbacteria bacterium]
MKQPLIRTIYLYLFALIGLVLMAIGTVRLTDLVLKTFIFTRADQELNYMKQPPMISLFPGKDVSEEDLVSTIEKCQEKCDLTADEKEQIDSWLKDYRNWQETVARMDYRAQQRDRDLAQSLAFILVGLPLYLYHWSTIKRETKNEAEA